MYGRITYFGRKSWYQVIFEENGEEQQEMFFVTSEKIQEIMKDIETGGGEIIDYFDHDEDYEEECVADLDAMHSLYEDWYFFAA